MVQAQAVDGTINYANMPRDIMLLGVIGYVMAIVAVIMFVAGIVHYVKAHRSSK